MSSDSKAEASCQWVALADALGIRDEFNSSYGRAWIALSACELGLERSRQSGGQGETVTTHFPLMPVASMISAEMFWLPGVIKTNPLVQVWEPASAGTK